MKKSALKRKRNLSLEAKVVNYGKQIASLKGKEEFKGYVEILKLKAKKLADVIQENKKIDMRAIQEAHANRTIKPHAPTLQTPKKVAEEWIMPENWGTSKRKAKKKLYNRNKKVKLRVLNHIKAKEKGDMKPKVSVRKQRLNALLVYFSTTKGIAVHHRKLVESLKKTKTAEFAKPMLPACMKRILKKRKSCMGNTKPDRIKRRMNHSEKRKLRGQFHTCLVA